MLGTFFRRPVKEISGLYFYKYFTIVIYNRNDSGQYYKNTIIVKASLSQP